MLKSVFTAKLASKIYNFFTLLAIFSLNSQASIDIFVANKLIFAMLAFILVNVQLFLNFFLAWYASKVSMFICLAFFQFFFFIFFYRIIIDNSLIFFVRYFIKTCTKITDYDISRFLKICWFFNCSSIFSHLNISFFANNAHFLAQRCTFRMHSSQKAINSITPQIASFWNIIWVRSHSMDCGICEHISKSLKISYDKIEIRHRICEMCKGCEIWICNYWIIVSVFFKVYLFNVNPRFCIKIFAPLKRFVYDLIYHWRDIKNFGKFFNFCTF